MGKCLFLRKGETHTAPVSGILASDIAIGSTVKLMENGTAVEYLVVHQGLPSSMYDASCDGCWLLRKDCYENRQWHSSNVNDYANSTIHAYLNGDFFNLFGDIEKSAIKQVKIPYRAGSGYGTTITSGASGLSANIFLLSGAELNWSSSITSYIVDDGTCLNYFSECGTTDSKRLAYLESTRVSWWLRSPYVKQKTVALMARNNGSYLDYGCTNEEGIRPALILPSAALFDKNTLILKGVA